mmetsp:Transcript_17517/g.20908  ORF Transcript_17517/g.20908 Transcript_17517/m.20908 type:complete len:80 (-) Transcript_17517:34-273(-)
MMYAIPTFQAPPTFFQTTTTTEQPNHQWQQRDQSNNEIGTTTLQLTILPDTQITRNILLALLEPSTSTSASNTANNNQS